MLSSLVCSFTSKLPIGENIKAQKDSRGRKFFPKDVFRFSNGKKPYKIFFPSEDVKCLLRLFSHSDIYCMKISEGFLRHLGGMLKKSSYLTCLFSSKWCQTIQFHSCIIIIYFHSFLVFLSLGFLFSLLWHNG